MPFAGPGGSVHYQVLGQGGKQMTVSIRLLGAIGGSEIVDPLLEVLDKSTSPGGRYEALLNLKRCSKAVARTIFRVAKGDPDPHVREQAEEELGWCSI
jgi:hypothetical protein